MEKNNKTPDWFLLEEVSLCYKRKLKVAARPLIKSSQDIGDLLMQIWDPERIELVEEFKVLFMNRANRIIGVMEVSSGGITGTVADPRIILAAALKCCAVTLILAHNHPSGSLKPSRADEELTRKIKGACELLDITVLDHLIITSDAYFSFADEGLL